MRIIVTGGCGFIGHHLVQHLLQTTNWHVIVVDKLSYASMGLRRLRDVEGGMDPSRVSLFTFDLAAPIEEGLRRELGEVDVIVHMAAETHVDNSIENPVHCVRNNVLSTLHLLEYARTLPSLKRFLYFSTDEVFGPALGETMYKEWDRHRPTNPYSASKSAGEMLCLSYQNTYRLPVTICNVMNVFGERQHLEKFIPLCIRKTLLGETIQIHCYPGCQRSGTRFYIHARNVASAVSFLLDHGEVGEKYNITGEEEVSNMRIAEMVAKELGRPLRVEMVDFHGARPGHDLRYGLDGQKLESMGWHLPRDFESSLRKTIQWFASNREWLDLPQEESEEYLDCTNQGVGNIVLSMAAYLAFERQRHNDPAFRPIVYCLRSYYLKGIRTDLFRIVEEPPVHARRFNMGVINLLLLSHPVVQQTMHEIVRPPVHPETIASWTAGAEAAFCIRTSDPSKWPTDKGTVFMNAVSVQTMLEEMRRYSRVLVCANEGAGIRQEDLPPGARLMRICETEEPCEGLRAWMQWHAIASCPVVYHGVAGGADGSITSTFAPTAAVFGGRRILGVDNDGNIYSDDKYHW